MSQEIGYTVCEMPIFTSLADKVMTAKDKSDFIDYIAHNPKAGQIMQGTAGARKIRFGRKGQGKRGSYRVVYYFHNPRNPLYLFVVFGKGEKSNMSKACRNDLKKVIQLIKKELRP